MSALWYWAAVLWACVQAGPCRWGVTHHPTSVSPHEWRGRGCGGTDAPVPRAASCTTGCSRAGSAGCANCAAGWWWWLQFNSVLISVLKQSLELFGGSHGPSPCAQLNKLGWKYRKAGKPQKRRNQMLLGGAPNLGSPCCLSIESACVKISCRTWSSNSWMCWGCSPKVFSCYRISDLGCRTTSFKAQKRASPHHLPTWITPVAKGPFTFSLKIGWKITVVIYSMLKFTSDKEYFVGFPSLN